MDKIIVTFAAFMACCVLANAFDPLTTRGLGANGNRFNSINGRGRLNNQWGTTGNNQWGTTRNNQWGNNRGILNNRGLATNRGTLSNGRTRNGQRNTLDNLTLLLPGK